MADLRVNVCGMKLAHPVMPAAGPNVMDAAAALRAVRGGASCALLKTISTRAACVPKPCMAPLGATGMLNCELWSESPPDQFIEHEYRAARQAGVPVIASVGYTAEDLAALGPKIEATGCVDAIEFSLHYTGAGIEPLVAAAKALRAAVKLPIFAKLSPGMPDIPAVGRALEPHVDGLVAVNSLGPGLELDLKKRAPRLGSEQGYGWMSGAPLKPIALRCVYELSGAVSKPIIGVGGIFTGEDAIEFIMAGASAVQICTAAILRGPAIYGAVARQMSEWMDANGVASISDIWGCALPRPGTARAQDFQGHPPRVDAEVCTACGLCVKVCPTQAITLENKTWRVGDAQCVRCGLCINICPVQALH